MGKRKLVDQLYNLCMEINGLEPRKAGISNAPTVTFEFSGHVAGIWIQVFLKGWKPNVKADYEANLYTDEPLFEEKEFRDVIEDLTRIRDEISCL